jgi:AraC-like DNA-binding protein
MKFFLSMAVIQAKSITKLYTIIVNTTIVTKLFPRPENGFLETEMRIYGHTCLIWPSMQVFVITGASVAAFFILFILSKKDRKGTDYLLVLINLLMIGFLVTDMLVRDELTVMRFFIQTLLPYYLFPVFLLFALETLQIKSQYRWLLIFLPAFITTAVVASDLFLIRDYDEPALSRLYNYPPVLYHILYKGNQVFFIFALFWLLRKLNAYAHEIKESFSFIEPIRLNWLTHFSWIYLGITFISLISFVISNLNFLPIDIKMAYTIVSICTILAIFYISFHGIRQYSIAEYYGSKLQAPEASDQKEKYKSSYLTPEELQAIYQQLISLFENQALYLESKLQLQDVADALAVTPHALSQTINTLAGKPFYDFVNSYRVKHLQKLLEDPAQRKFTILAMGLESGFNSKASINRVFKQETGLSPSEYQSRRPLK